MSILIKGMEMPTTCCHCKLMVCNPELVWDDAGVERTGTWVCLLTGELIDNTKCEEHCPLVPVPDHRGLFDVGQFEKGCFYGYGHDGKVYKLLWDTKVFDGAKKFYLNPIIPGEEAGNG